MAIVEVGVMYLSATALHGHKRVSPSKREAPPSASADEGRAAATQGRKPGGAVSWGGKERSNNVLHLAHLRALATPPKAVEGEGVPWAGWLGSPGAQVSTGRYTD